MITDINSEDRLVQETIAAFLHDALGWDSVYARNQETFGPQGMLGRANERDVVLLRDLRFAVESLNPGLPPKVVDEVLQKLTHFDHARSTLQHNHAFYKWLRDGVPVSFRNDQNELKRTHARVLDFRHPASNRFLAVRELKIQGLRVPHYNRRADLVYFVNGLPLVFIELKAVYRNIRAAYDGNLSDYYDTVPHVFYHNAFVVVSNGHRGHYGSITSTWEHFHEEKRPHPLVHERRVVLIGQVGRAGHGDQPAVRVAAGPRFGILSQHAAAQIVSFAHQQQAGARHQVSRLGVRSPGDGGPDSHHGFARHRLHRGQGFVAHVVVDRDGLRDTAPKARQVREAQTKGRQVRGHLRH